MDYVNSALSSVSDSATSMKNRLFPPAQPQGAVGGRRKTRRRNSHKVKRRRTGRSSIGFLRLFRK